jgi:hypothetical protein
MLFAARASLDPGFLPQAFSDVILRAGGKSADGCLLPGSVPRIEKWINTL